MFDVAKASDLSKAISDQLSMLPTVTREIIDRQSNKFATEAVRDLKRTSPVGHGDYAKSWAKTKDTSGGVGVGVVYRVYNKKHYRLTHLLEYGHILHTTGERTRAIPHISVVEKKIADEYSKRVEEDINSAFR